MRKRRSGGSYRYMVISWKKADPRGTVRLDGPTHFRDLGMEMYVKARRERRKALLVHVVEPRGLEARPRLPDEL